MINRGNALTLQSICFAPGGVSNFKEFLDDTLPEKFFGHSVELTRYYFFRNKYEGSLNLRSHEQIFSAGNSDGKQKVRIHV